MKAIEFLYESYIEELNTNLMDLLVIASHSGASSIKTKNIVRQMNNLGYSVDEDGLVAALGGNPLVSNADENTITLIANQDGMGGAEGDSAENKAESDADHVAKMAKSAAKPG